MTSPLIPVRELVADSWNHYVKHWNRLMEASLWLLAFPFLILVAAFALAPYNLNAALSVFTLLSLLDGLFGIWITIRLIKLALARNPQEEGAILGNLKTGWNVYLPLLWVTILDGLAVLAGTLLLFFPGIWVGVLFAFAQIMTVMENRRGLQALAASAALVKGRWWATLWRIVVPGAFFMLLVYATLQAISFLVGLVAGFDTVNQVMNAVVEAETLTPEVLKANAISVFFGRLPEAMFLPLYLLALTKLYRSLKETR